MDQLPPNVRTVEASLSETWPSSMVPGGSFTFGPVRESMQVCLPLPCELEKKTPQEQWDWLRAKENSFVANSAIATWGSLCWKEKAAMSARVRAAVIEQVNEALRNGLVAAPKRDPQTGRMVA